MNDLNPFSKDIAYRVQNAFRPFRLRFRPEDRRLGSLGFGQHQISIEHHVAEFFFFFLLCRKLSFDEIYRNSKAFKTINQENAHRSLFCLMGLEVHITRLEANILKIQNDF